MKTDGIAFFFFFSGGIARPSLLLVKTILARGAVGINQPAVRLETDFWESGCEGRGC